MNLIRGGSQSSQRGRQAEYLISIEKDGHPDLTVWVPSKKLLQLNGLAMKDLENLTGEEAYLRWGCELATRGPRILEEGQTGVFTASDEASPRNRCVHYFVRAWGWEICAAVLWRGSLRGESS